MTECTCKTLQSSSLSRKKILANFDGVHLTSDGGALLLREANRRTGLIDALAECIADPREPHKIKHDVKTMLAQRVYGIALGYEDGNDHQTLRNDPMMPMLAEAAPDPDDPLASPSTRCRFENGVNRKSLARMSDVFVDPFIASYRLAPQGIVLDFDATGEKQRSFHEFEYGAQTWDRKRRVILKAEHLTKGANARFVVTNLDHPPARLWRRCGCRCCRSRIQPSRARSNYYCTF